MQSKCGHNIQFKDISSAANIDEAVIRHIHLQWDVNFETKILIGKCFLDVDVLKNTDRIVLDLRDIKISDIQSDGEKLAYDIEENGALGQKLIIKSVFQQGNKM